MEDVSSKDLLFWGAIAVGAYLLYRVIAPVIGAAGTAISAVGTGVGMAAGGAANLWVSLTSAPPMNVPGTVQFPDGTQVPIASLPIKTDASGAVYTNTGGRTFQ